MMTAVVRQTPLNGCYRALGAMTAGGREATDALDPDSTTLIKVIRIRGTALSAASTSRAARFNE
jgi:hypothetical protein